MRYPAFPLLAFCVAGAWLADVLSRQTALWVAVALALAALVLASMRGWKFAIWIAMAIFSGAHLWFLSNPTSPSDLRCIVPQGTTDGDIRGILTETPRQRSYMRKAEVSTRFTVPVDVTEIRLANGEWRPAAGRVMVTTPELPQPLYSGQAVELVGEISRPPGPAAEGMFDYAAYLARHGIYYRMRCASAASWRLAGPITEPSASDRFVAWARRTLQRGLPSPEPDEPTRLLWSMTLGVQDDLTSESFEPFLAAGTMHVFAISGLHIALLGGAIIRLVQLARAPRLIAYAAMLAGIWAYTAASGWQPSAIRATVMMSIMAVGWLLRRPTNFINSLLAAALLILLCDPRQMFGASLQLSFCVVMAIALIVPPLEAVKESAVRWVLSIDVLQLHELLPAWKRALRGVVRDLYLFVIVSVAAFLGAVPLIASYFHLLTWTSIPANLLVVPASSLALAANFGALALCWTPLCETLNNAAWGLMRFMEWASEVAVARTHGFMYVPQPSTPWIICIYAIAVVWLLPELRRGISRAKVYLCGAPVVLFLIAQSIYALQTTELTALSVRGGMAVHVDAPGRANDMLVDCGDDEGARLLTVPFLKAHGVNALPTLVLTHGDSQHVSGAGRLDSDFRVGQVAASGARFRSSVYRKVLDHFSASPGRLRVVSLGESIGYWRVLHPVQGDKFPRADDGALVLCGTISGVRVLLASDLSDAGQHLMLERSREHMQADILIGSLAADGTAFGREFLQAVRPKLVVVCDSEGPFVQKAGARLRETLAAAGCESWFVAECGTVTLSCRSGRCAARTMSGRKMDFTAQQASGQVPLGSNHSSGVATNFVATVR